MANRIKGITIEIGGDSTGLDKALAGAAQKSKSLQSELKEVNNALKFDPGNVELLAQKQQILTDSVNATAEKLRTLKDAQAQVQRQFENGDINAEQYRAFQREIQKAESSMRTFETQLARMAEAQQKSEEATRDLNKVLQLSGKSIDDFADTIGQDLVNAIKEGRASTAQLETALSQIGRSVTGTETDINQLRDALRNLDGGGSIEELRRDLQRVGDEAQDTGRDVDKLGDKLSGLGGIAAGVSLAGLGSAALSNDQLETKIKVTFDVPETSYDSVKDAVRSVEKYGLDVNESLEGVRRQWALNKDATDEANAAMVEGAAVIASNFEGIDFMELIQETNEFAAALEISNEEALAMTNSLLKFGFPPEQLDILSEYGLQMKQVGFSTAEIQAIFEKGVDLKSWNVDNLNDGIKEANLKMREFGQEVPSALADLLEGTDVSAKQMQAWGKAVAAGGEGGAKAMGEVSDWLQTIEDDALRNQLAIQVFGTKAEDQGDNMIKVFQGLADVQDKTTENQEGLNNAIEETNSGALVQLKEAFFSLMEALEPLFEVIANVIGAFASFVTEHPKISAAIALLVAGFALVVGALTVIAPIVTAVMSVIGALGAGFTAIAAGPIAIVVGAILGIVAVVAILIAAWEPLTKFFGVLWDGIVAVFKGAVKWLTEELPKLLKAGFEIAINVIKAVWNALPAFFDGLWSGITKFFKNGMKFFTDDIPKIFKKVVDGIINAFKKLPDGIKNIFSGLVNIMKIPINNMIKLLNGFLKGLNKIKIPDWVPAVGGKGFSIPQIPMLAKGTNYFKGGKAIVGEVGPELVELPTGAKVHNANKTADMLGADASGVVITGNNFTIRQESDIKKVAKELYILQQQNNRGRGNR